MKLILLAVFGLDIAILKTSITKQLKNDENILSEVKIFMFDNLLPSFYNVYSLALAVNFKPSLVLEN